MLYRVWKSINLSIPPQCVLLEHVACKSHWLKEDMYGKINDEELKEKGIERAVNWLDIKDMLL